MRLRVSGDGRRLEREGGQPFFWLGDTAWELVHRLTRGETRAYLEGRRAQGFTVIQTVALAELDGLRTPNAAGRLPLHPDAAGIPDPTRPDTGGPNSYWDHLDGVVSDAANLGLYLALLPTWGDKFNRLWGEGPEVFTPENAEVFGRWIGERYRKAPNLVWALGGDRPLTTERHAETMRRLAAGLRAGDGGAHLLTFHPPGGTSSSAHVGEEAWPDFHMVQSGHSRSNPPGDALISHDYALTPTRPVLDGEPPYEDHPIDFDAANGYFDAYDARRAGHRATFAGAFGHTYGHHCVWGFRREGEEWPGKPGYFVTDWRTALDRPGAWQMRHLRTLLESRPARGREPCPALLAGNWPGETRLDALRGDGHALVYSPYGLPITVSRDALGFEVARAGWFDPRTGETRLVELSQTGETQRFVPPSAGRGEDWVLVLDADPGHDRKDERP